MAKKWTRSSGRCFDQLRQLRLTPNFIENAEGSCFIELGNTRIICTASVETQVPRWLRDTGKGWVTAEYGMLPRSTHSRINREAKIGKQSGRTQEIQRLIGRSLRSIINLNEMNGIQIHVDCDVLQADGGTRTASITGAYIALYNALLHCLKSNLIDKMPLNNSVAAISCGVVNHQALLDLEYCEDSIAEVDANFVMTGQNNIIEIQSTAEGAPFSEKIFYELLKLAKQGCAILTGLQNDAITKP